MIMGVVADDITGANDIGIMVARAGYLVHVYSYVEAGGLDYSGQSPNVAVLDTNSRLDPPDLAYRKVFNATQELRSAGCQQFFNKTCSVFRGNIGAEFDAMLDALGQEFAVIVLGFPKNGRTTRNGIHYVHGKKLEDSEFRDDPAHPMRQSNLIDILQSQTRRRVGLIDHTVVKRGAPVLREAIERARAQVNYVILDVTEQDSLRTIADVVSDMPVLCGSSALAEELPAVWKQPADVHPMPSIPLVEGIGLLCTAGSLMPQTAAQIVYVQERGVPLFELNPLDLFDRCTETMGALQTDVIQTLRQGTDAILHTSNITVNQVHEEGKRRGLTKPQVSRLVSVSLAELSARIMLETGQNRLLVAGGETSNALCRRLGITGLRIWKEIQPGLPSCFTLSAPPLMLVLKSGSFGSPAFFAEAIAHLKGQLCSR